MQQEIRFATFNLYNLAPPGVKLYDNLLPTTPAEYEAKLDWTARQIDLLDADVIGFQEIFSQAALLAALARTRRYRDAVHVGFDPDPAAERLTPSVALVSRLPLAAPGVAHLAFPEGVALPPGSREADRFSRAVIHAPVIVSPDCTVDVVVVHLKSKRPDYNTGNSSGANSDDAQLYALACLRSLIRRGTEAAALRVLLSQLAKENRRPRVVLGDFNDVADAVSTMLVLGNGNTLGERMFDAYQLQQRQDHLRHVGFSILHDSHYTTIDHILVSEEFNASLPNAIGDVVDVVYLNDHVVLELPEASDHGQVLARIRLFDGPRGA
ncbi:endonuclease/exonuclease/phosphatase family protein [Massilia genomosp. 1]|uniref:Endonuclease/exonuclease/phosphatase family protein n=1 Tax=Massilia genomosp. 1 TaxID=2609280 RepID=A0ABX0MGA1_9BURK|nr:endonuclease/exonuclease/phosphatase family protein [Massilia genomosp. 1]NHZ61793.1 endonuclease/exonuclease/phosphatase family protein [Massilia genomosp. 1]